MRTIFDPATGLRRWAATDGGWIGQIIRRCWKALQKWDIEQAAIARLSSMSDRELKDIGLHRSEIRFVVRGDLTHHYRRAS